MNKHTGTGSRPRFHRIVPKIMWALAVSEPYALRIRGGQCVPHPRHWLRLANLTLTTPEIL